MLEWLEASDRAIGGISALSFEGQQQPFEKAAGQAKAKASSASSSKKPAKTKAKQDNSASAAGERAKCVPPYYKDDEGHVWACEFQGDQPRYLGQGRPTH